MATFGQELEKQKAALRQVFEGVQVLGFDREDAGRLLSDILENECYPYSDGNPYSEPIWQYHWDLIKERKP